MKIVKILWLDASYTDRSIVPQDIPSPLVLESVGWLVQEKKESISIAQEICKEENTYRHTITIPRKYIKKMRVIKI